MGKTIEFASLIYAYHVWAPYAVYVTYIYAENNKVMFHEFSIFSIFKRLVRNRLNIEKYCKDKSLCVFKNT